MGTLCDGVGAEEKEVAGLSCGEDVVGMRTTLLRRRSAQEHALIICSIYFHDQIDKMLTHVSYAKCTLHIFL